MASWWIECLLLYAFFATCCCLWLLKKSIETTAGLQADLESERAALKSDRAKAEGVLRQAKHQATNLEQLMYENIALKEQIQQQYGNLSESLRPTDESHHHQQRLARRLEVARAISGSWTLSRDPANIAEKLVDGSYDALRTYVAGPEGQEASTSGAVDTRDAADLSYEEFWLQYMFPNRPVMIRNVGKQWRATREWVTSEGSVNAKFLSETFGEAKVWVTHCAPLAGDSGEKSAGEREQWTLAEYLDYFTTKDEDPRLLYLKDWHFPYEFSHYKAYETPEYFREDWLNEYYDYSQSQRKEGERSQQTIESSDYRFVYLGPEGTKTGLHADVLRSYSWSINIVGKKRWYLLPPQYTHLLYDTFGQNLAPCFFDADEATFPNLRLARAHLVEVVQNECEVLFVPSGWHHTVENMRDTLSINHNWFNACNLNYAMELLERERHEAAQAICDCRDLCATDEEFEALVQRNVAANASMNYADFSRLLLMVAESRASILETKGGEGDTRALLDLYEAKLACAALDKLAVHDWELEARTAKVKDRLCQRKVNLF